MLTAWSCLRPVNKLTVMCTTRSGERRLIILRYQKECAESKNDGQTKESTRNLPETALV